MLEFLLMVTHQLLDYRALLLELPLALVHSIQVEAFLHLDSELLGLVLDLKEEELVLSAEALDFPVLVVWAECLCLVVVLVRLQNGCLNLSHIL
jgi:hypothetical protein